jgi:SAM-dependent methyltransferase
MPKALLTSLMMQAPYQPATNYWRAFEIGEVIQYGFPSGRGLDLGCGDGHLMGIILDSTGSRDLIGLDVDPQETAIARARNIYRDVVTAPADHMPFSDGDFDYVFSNSVLEHIENIDGVLQQVARVLRLDGRFLVTVPGPNFHDSLRGPRSGDREGYLRTVDARCAHLRYWNVEQWTESLREAGLTLIHSHEYLAETQVQRWDTIARHTSGLLMGLARRKKRPIEIQRLLRIRSSRIRLPKVVASVVANLMQIGGGEESSRFGCLLIEARRR